VIRPRRGRAGIRGVAVEREGEYGEKSSLAAGLTESAVEAPVPLVQEPASARSKAGTRFMVVYAVLGLVLLVSVVAFVVYALQPGLTSSSAWSSWSPPQGSLPVVAKAIADHVAPNYRLATGGQLVAVVPSPPTVTAGTQNVTIDAVSMKSAQTGDQTVRQLGLGKTEMYTLCGLGDHCAIASGTPSVSRGRLVRREGLEAALYTFKHVPAVDSVLVFLPSVAGSTDTRALFFQRSDLAAQLDQPLRDTLPLATPPRAGKDDPTEVNVIDQLTLKHYYTSQLVELQVGGTLLALTPLV
jgi:hypothetical protein